MSIIRDPQHIRTFVLAGNATFTLSSYTTKAHYTYKVTEVPEKNSRYFVSLLNGPDNESDYIYLGMIFGDEPDFRTTRASRMDMTSTPARAIKFFCNKVLRDKRAPNELHLEFRHEGRCGRCNRKLTVPASIDRGIGPECASHMGIDLSQRPAPATVVTLPVAVENNAMSSTSFGQNRSKTDNVLCFTAFLSDIAHDLKTQQIYNGAGQPGIAIRMENTGKVVAFWPFETFKDDDGDAQYWTLKPSAEDIRKDASLASMQVIFYND